MKIIIFGDELISVGDRLGKEGHDVLLYSTSKSTGEGLVKRTKLIQPLTGGSETDRFLRKHSPDLIICSPKYSLLGISFRERQLPCFGAGTLPELNGREKLVNEVLRRFKVERGESMGVWNGEEFIWKWDWLEESNLIGRDSGIQVGAGAVGYVGGGGSLSSLIPLLKKHQYRGFIGIKGNSLTFTFPFSFFEIYLGNLGDFFLKVSTLQRPEGKLIERTYFTQLLTSLPPFPFGEFYNLKPIKSLLLPIEREALKHWWLDDVMVEDNLLKCVGNSGRVGVLTSRGGTVKEAVKRLYRTLAVHQVIPFQYRTDLGFRANKFFGLV